MFSLTPYNTFGLQVAARRGLIVRSGRDLEGVDDELILILGQGSDVLLTEDFHGTALINALPGLEIHRARRAHEVRLGGGEQLDAAIAQLLRQGIPGLERLSCIPGTVGAAPVQNVGAYGTELGTFIERVEAFCLRERRRVCLERGDCAFGYRTSAFCTPALRHLFITGVHLRLPCAESGVHAGVLRRALAVRREVSELRRRKLPDPRHVGNAGSFFRNPHVAAGQLHELRAELPDLPAWPQDGGQYKISAAYLIDRAGLRGITRGRAGTWEHQALVLVNRGRAHPHEILSLAKYIAARVLEHFGVVLEPEVRIFGSRGELAWREI